MNKKRKHGGVLFLIMLLMAMLLLPGCGKDKKQDSETTDTKTEQAEEKDSDTDKQSDQDAKKTKTKKRKKNDVTGAIEDGTTAFTEEIAGIEIPKDNCTITISAVGDCALGSIEGAAYDYSLDSYYDYQGADYFLSDVKSVFEKDDVTIANLECVLSDSTDIQAKEFNIEGDPEYISILTGSSVEAVSLANNHTHDYGESGFADTENTVKEAGLAYAYAGKSDMIETADGAKVGFVAGTYWSDFESDLNQSLDEIDQLKEDGADIIVVMAHWGTELVAEPDPYMQTAAHALIDEGADLVVGGHAHIVGAMEEYKGKVICYTMGNFCFGANSNPTSRDSMIYQQTFTITDGELEDTVDAKVIPCLISSTSYGLNDYHPTIATGDSKSQIISTINSYSESYSDLTLDADGNVCFEEE